MPDWISVLTIIAGGGGAIGVLARWMLSVIKQTLDAAQQLREEQRAEIDSLRDELRELTRNYSQVQQRCFDLEMKLVAGEQRERQLEQQLKQAQDRISMLEAGEARRTG